MYPFEKGGKRAAVARARKKAGGGEGVGSLFPRLSQRGGGGGRGDIDREMEREGDRLAEELWGILGEQRVW